MEPLETLRNEHGLIRQFLDNLSIAAEKLENEQRPPTDFFVKATDFARNFADTFHHVKEEHVMFVRLAQKKSGEIDGQVDALRHQHERARDYMAGIRGDLNAYDEGSPIAASRVLENIGAYVALMRNHIHKEDHVFFPMVKGELTPEEEALVKKEFDRARIKSGEDTFETNHKLVVDMGSLLAHMQ
jgi:hemerythrin-like domain-containing protein